MRDGTKVSILYGTRILKGRVKNDDGQAFDLVDIKPVDGRPVIQEPFCMLRDWPSVKKIVWSEKGD